MTLTAREALILLVVAVIGFAYYTHEQRVQGAQAVLLHQADSIAHVRAREQAAAHDVAVKAVASADSLRRLSRIEVAKDAKVRARTDSSIREASNARAQAEATLRDSLATVTTLRSDLLALVASSRRDSIAFAAERYQRDAANRALILSLQADSTAIAIGIAAENAAIARAVAAERQVAILRSSRPSTVGNLMRAGLYVAVGVGLGHLVR